MATQDKAAGLHAGSMTPKRQAGIFDCLDGLLQPAQARAIVPIYFALDRRVGVAKQSATIIFGDAGLAEPRGMILADE